MPFRPVAWIFPAEAIVEDQLFGSLKAITHIEPAIIRNRRWNERKFCFGGLGKTQQVGCEWIAGKGIGKSESFHIRGVGLPIVVRSAADFSAEPDRMTTEDLRLASGDSIVFFGDEDLLAATAIDG